MNDEAHLLRMELNQLQGAIDRLVQEWTRPLARNVSDYQQGYEDALERCASSLAALIEGEA